MAFELTELQDCLLITKKYERAAAFAPTEEAVYAMMTVPLNNMRVHAQGFIKQVDNDTALSTPLTTTKKLQSTSAGQTASAAALGSNAVALESTGVNTANLNNADENQDFFDRIAGNFFPNTGNINDLGGVFDSECIPCGFRLDTTGQLVQLAITSPIGGLSEFFKFWEEWLRTYIQQINDMINMFKNIDQYVDMCAMVKFLNDFVCIPDLQRMLSAMMGLMNRSSFQFGSLLDIIVGLVGPLLTPFLSSLVNELNKYILMVIKPLECIIDSIQAIIAKLDYNVLFQNIDTLDRHASLGPKVGQKKKREDRSTVPTFIPFVGGFEFGISEETIGNNRRAQADFNLGGPVGTAIKAENAKNQAAVEEKAENLAKVRKSANNVDGSDPDAIRRYREREKKAREEYEAAVEERNLSEIGQLNRTVDRTIASLKSSLFMLTGYLREAAEAIEGLFKDLFDELKKLMGEYVGGSGNFINELVNKLALTQMIGLIASIIGAFQNGINCDGDDEDIQVEAFLPIQQSFSIWTDDQGNIHIEEDPNSVEDAIDNFVESSGNRPPGSVDDTKEDDRGDGADRARQKLKSLIEFTGDPTLDLDIARATEQLVTPVSLQFKCPLNTSVAQASKINQFISEINSLS